MKLYTLAHVILRVGTIYVMNGKLHIYCCLQYRLFVKNTSQNQISRQRVATRAQSSTVSNINDTIKTNPLNLNAIQIEFIILYIRLYSV